MGEGFTPHVDLFLTLNLEEVVEKLDLLGVICCEVLCLFFRNKFEELGRSSHHSIA